MDAVEKLRDRARKYLAAGKLEKAIDAYKFLNEHDSVNPRWSHKLGELHHRLSDNDAAVLNFERAAKLYAEQGFLLKGIALCRQILSLDSNHECSQAMLSELVERRSIPQTTKPPAATASMPADPSLRSLEVSMEIDVSGAEVPEVEVPEVESMAEDEFSREPSGLKEFSLEHGQTLDSIRLADVFEAEERAALAAADAPTKSTGIYTVDLDDDVDDAAFEALSSCDEQEDEGLSLLEKVRPTPLFDALEPDALRLLVAELDLRFYKKGDVIIREGAEGDSLYVLVEGEVMVYREGPPRIDVAQLDDGAFFGEIALLTQRKRTATVETLDDCTMLELSRDTVGRLVTQYPSALKVLLRFFRERLVDTLVDTHPLFAPFGGGEREALARRFSFIEVMRGRELAKEGERVEGLYVLLSGKLEGSTMAGGAFEMKTGDVFGETSLLSGSCAPFTVKSKDRSWLLLLDDEVFREVIMTHPQVLEVVSGLVEQHAKERQIAKVPQAPVV
ncbi:MAG: cyclic nucleotide-binding domain-containing protein [Deltaproteobacteria bacterium]|nr:cyclic nucleotide-binding domain-containing protein [Deltaproteobacteria bacterium]